MGLLTRASGPPAVHDLIGAHGACHPIPARARAAYDKTLVGGCGVGTGLSGADALLGLARAFF